MVVVAVKVVVVIRLFDPPMLVFLVSFVEVFLSMVACSPLMCMLRRESKKEWLGVMSGLPSELKDENVYLLRLALSSLIFCLAKRSSGSPNSTGVSCLEFSDGLLCDFFPFPSSSFLAGSPMSYDFSF